ncbi:hypothetical protein [Halorubrum yunnanense]|uniref:Uncharacterized protein n=1 Tax=Halorubrum yunnanense TaxID=1526162 RepID=A0ABD5YFH9_9EURY|nr:hypothetical protein [Halorubrum yunnanense]
MQHTIHSTQQPPISPITAILLLGGYLLLVASAAVPLTVHLPPFLASLAICTFSVVPLVILLALAVSRSA